MEVSEARQLKSLEEENRQLKKLLAERGWLGARCRGAGDVPTLKPVQSTDRHRRGAFSDHGPNYGDEHTTRKPKLLTRCFRSKLRRSAERTRTGKPSMHDFVKLHAAEFTPRENHGLSEG